jgi:hypothetical protein
MGFSRASPEESLSCISSLHHGARTTLMDVSPAKETGELKDATLNTDLGQPEASLSPSASYIVHLIMEGQR